MQSLSYEQMKMELSRFKIPSTGAVIGKLSEISIAAVVCATIAKVYPRDYKKRLKPLSQNPGWMLPTSIHDETSPTSVTITEMIHQNLFPVDDGWADMEEMDFREDAILHLGLAGYKMTFDEFSDMVSTDPAELSDYAGFCIMTCILGGWLDDDLDRYWKIYNARFQWGIPETPKLPGYDYYLNLKAFQRELKRRAIGPLYTLFMAIDGSTGNIFFDFDYEMEMPPTITLGNLVYLHKQWQKSLPLIKECNKAHDLIMKGSKTYLKFLDAYKASLRKRKE